MSKIEAKVQTPKEAKIEASLAEVEEVPYGEVLTSVFRNNTLPESRELRGDVIYGKVQTGEDSPVMELSLRDFEYEKGAVLEIFSEESRAGWAMDLEDVRFFAGKKLLRSSYPWEKDDITVRFSSRHSLVLRDPYSDELSLVSGYDNWLIKVVSEVSLKASQIPKEKIKEGG